MSGVVHDLVQHWYIDFSIPIVAAIIGYVTKLVAIRSSWRTSSPSRCAEPPKTSPAR
ncbi:MAG: hypothetical protein JWO57_2247 [Pseudonocardiales bacterium]|nr:hypothetical protein [Pseudonocardiales bacterium]